MLMRLGGVKYSLIPSRLKDGVWSGQGVGRGVHQLWKQRGEEYRVTGKNGWSWRSATRVQHKPLSKVEILKTDELTEEEEHKVANTETINVMREIRLRSVDDKRIYYPKKFNKKACPKLELLEGLLDKRLRLKKALELEKSRSEKSSKQSTEEEKLELGCYSLDCRELQQQNKTRDISCYSHDCRKLTNQQLDNEDSEEEIRKETSEVFYCVKPVYLFNTTSDYCIQRKLNSKRLLVKGKLPPCSKFESKSGKKSIFVLPNYELRQLGRSGALKEVCGFSYTAKSNPYIWPFHTTPRPSFRTCWLYRNSIIEKTDGLESVALSLRIIWHCIRWDDMANKQSSNTITTETDIITTELLKRRDLAPFGIRSEYLVRKIVVPIEFENEKDDNEWHDSSIRYTDLSAIGSKREGLRERRKKNEENELRKQGPSVTETWTPEEELQLWEIRSFGEKLEKQQQMIKERERERLQKENTEKARKAYEEQRAAKKLNSENARITPVIQKSGPMFKRVLTQNNNSSNQQQQNQGGFAMIRTLGGQTYRIPVSALQGKKPGQQIVIKTGNPSSGQFTNTTTATIISTCTQPAVTPANTTSQQLQTTPSLTNSLPSTTTVRPLILSGNNSNLATGIAASSLQSQPKIQFIKQITAPTASANQILTSSSSNTVTTGTLTQQQSQQKPQSITQSTTTNTTTSAPTTTTIKLIPATNAQNQSQSNSQATVQIPIKLPDGRMQIIQLPASMLNSSTPIQISIPQQASTNSTNTTSATPTKIRTITAPQNIPAGTPIIRAITPSSSSSPLPIIRTITASSSLANSSTKTPIIRAITPVNATTNAISQQPILRSVPANSIVQASVKPTIIKAEPASSTTSSSTSTSTSTSLINSTSTSLIANTQKPLLQHQLLEDNLSQTDSTLKTETSSFQLTPQYKQEMLKAALSSKTNTPEIQQKLLALQKHTQQQLHDDKQPASSSSKAVSNQSTSRRSTAGGLIRGSLSGRREMNSSLQHIQSRNKGNLEEERDDIVVKTIIKAMIDKIEKEEKLELKRKKARENQLQAKWRQHTLKMNIKLSRNADSIKRGMLKRRALYQKNVKQSIDAEIEAIEKIHPPRNSVLGSENSVDQPTLVELNNKEKWNRSMHQQQQTSRSSSGEDSLVMANNADCVNSLVSFTSSSSTKRKSTAQPSTLNNTNNKNHNLLNDASRSSSRSPKTKSISKLNKSKSSSSSPSTTKLFKSKASSNAIHKKFKKAKRPPLISFQLSEHQFNDRFLTMDTANSTANETGNANNKQKRLFCICRQPYDSNRFMIGCDYCHNWFHSSCLNLDEDEVKKMASFICQNCRDTHGSELDDEEFIEEEDEELSDEEELDDEEEDLNETSHSIDTKVNLNNHEQQQQPKISPTPSSNNKRKSSAINNSSSNLVNGGAVKSQTVQKSQFQSKQQQQKPSVKKQRVEDKKVSREQKNNEELFCICQTPYNESQFYVQCDKCEEWLHIRCIGLLGKEFEKIDVYLCPDCDPSSTINYANQKKLDSNNYEQLKKLLRSIQQHKSAWPFLRPVDERQVPDYYEIIKDPMDLSTIESKLNRQAYANLTKFIGDVTQIFDNCHYYNDSKSSVVTCANNLESHFVGLISRFRQQMIRE